MDEEKGASPKISVVSPVYRAEACIDELCCRLIAALEKCSFSFEIILVEDGGQDRSWEIISKLATRDSRIKGVKLSRNFGQHYAITAGLDYSTGDWVVVMDCDLQDRPEEIENLYRKAQAGYDMVVALRQERQDGYLKVICGRIFYRVLGYLTNSQWDSRVGSFRIMSRKVVASFCRMREQSRFFGGMMQWVGFKAAKIEVIHASRFTGPSSYNFRRLAKLALGGMLSFSEKPLYLSIFIGFSISLGSFACGTYLVARKIFFGIPIEGWTSLIVSLYFLAGLVLLNLGVLGLYVGRIFIETKARPLYVVEDSIGV